MINCPKRVNCLRDFDNPIFLSFTYSENFNAVGFGQVMSDAASLSLDLHSLEQELQACLHAEPLQSKPLQVRCVFKEGILIVLVQHAAPAMPYPRRAFRLIRNLLHDKNILKQYQVLMYLRVEGTNQPYAFHTLTEQSQPVAEESDLPPVAARTAAMQQPAVADTSRPKSTPETFSSVIIEEEAIAPEAMLEEERLAAFARELEAQESETETLAPSPEEEAESAAESFSLPEEEEEENIGFEGFTAEDTNFTNYSETPDDVGDRRLSKATLAFAAGLAVVFAGSAFYVLSRPCVIDRCETMTRAEKLSEQSLQTFQNSPSGQEILAAQGQLKEAIKKLEAIPFWSPRYTEAQKKLKEYRTLTASLTKVINSLYKASEAAQMSQKPPFSVEQWQKIAAQWEAAIAGLKDIPPQDFYHPFAQSKLETYQSNLNAVQQRLTQEQNALATLEQAKEAAKIAQVQQGVAQSLDSWEQAYLSWATAVQKLESIPEGTTAYQEAQDLIQSYSPQMATSQENQSKETLAQSIYDQGLRIAELARAAELEEDWQQALFHWKNAVKYMEGIPADSYQATLAQAAIARFNESLETSEVQFQLYTRLKKAEADLQKTCAGNPNVCTFTLDANNISVRLTAAYVNNVQKTAVQASATNNSDAKIRLLDHIATLEQALKVISQNTGVPVQVYDVNGVLLVDYKPE